MGDKKEVESYFERNFPKYQANYQKGEMLLNVRGDDRAKVMSDIKEMVDEWGNWVGSQGEVSSEKADGGKTEGAVVSKCPKCGGEVKFYSKTKAGGYKPRNTCSSQGCDYVEWL